MSMQMQSATGRRDPPPRTTRAAGALRHLLLLSCACAVAIALALNALWLAAGVRHVVDGRVADVVTRVALKAGVSAKDAEALAARLRAETPGVDVTLIGEEEARTLLSLQEPWMKDLPAVEIGRLPTLLEIRHPARLDSPTAVYAYNQALERLPECDFVEFNATGYDGMVSLLRNVRGYARLSAAVFCALAALGYALALLLARPRAGGGLPAALVAALVVTLCGYVGGLVLHSAVASAAGSRVHPLPSLGAGTLTLVALAAFVITLLLELRALRAGQPAPRTGQRP